ncbi:hypothetical protein TWF694_011047 [Orbilia ellipsospora]|uniref:Nephrocystin 3-like N-terminal domain-containing protein n=1 Tax=Orbilia ellipsospora TaxID=2528407 RepID=A0AAV9X7U8_9PEZI
MGRKTLSQCFNKAHSRFLEEVAQPLLKDPKRAKKVEMFLKGTKLEELKCVCKDLSAKAEEKSKNTASQLLTTIDQFKDAVDVFLQYAPETVSIVWFGISSLISIGSAEVETRFLICGTCDSIANIIGDCLKWEARMVNNKMAENFDVWESDIPELVFRIIDFLWNAQPHLDHSRMKKYVSIGDELVDIVQKQALIQELDRHQAKLTHPLSYKIHFTTLNDQLSNIMKDRNDRPVVAWLYEDEAYINWKGALNGSSFLCLQGSRGYGKSIAMMSIYRDLSTGLSTNSRPSLVCPFFFKKGEQDIQQARSALESILYQILNSSELRGDIDALISTINILNPEFGNDSREKQRGVTFINFWDSHQSLCETIRTISAVIPVPVFIMLDALDECVDRREQGLFSNLLSLVEFGDSPSFGPHSLRRMSAHDINPNNLRLIASVRTGIDVFGELKGSNNADIYDPETLLTLQRFEIIEITSNKNSSDLRDYLTNDVGILLTRRISRKEYASYYESELRRIVNIIHEKTKGDFTLARMIVANLQQPSKDLLDRRIRNLPSAIGDIYMSSLESLTPDEQELIVTTLKWVVWTVSGVTILEIIDHYREIYEDVAPNDIEEDDKTESEKLEQRNQELQAIRKKPLYTNPYDEPEVKDVIYHLENAGRDFFKFNRKTGLVTVDISVREWIQEDAQGSKSAIQDSRGFSKYRDAKGNTIFRFTLTPSFVRYGDSLSELFNGKEAQMSIAVSILRALNHERFQKKYMRWKPEWANWVFDEQEPKQQRRYEIDHWQDHIRILQKWWTKDSLEDSWWSELLTQLSIFTKSESWNLWNLQREFLPETDEEATWVDWRTAYMNRVFEEPIHLACEFGLHLLVDLLVRDAAITTNTKTVDSSTIQPDEMKALKTARAEAFIQVHIFAIPLMRSLNSFLPFMDRDQLMEMLDAEIVSEYSSGTLLPLLREELLTIPADAWIVSPQPLCDRVAPDAQTPLKLAAGSPRTVKQLLMHGADINQSIHTGEGGSKMGAPLLSILLDIVRIVKRNPDDEAALPLLQSAKVLVSEGARLDIRDEDDATLLHLAARARNLRFFKKLCVSEEWDVHTRDKFGLTPLHYLFLDPPPKNSDKIGEVLSICRLTAKMQQSDRDEVLVNAEDGKSMNPLAYAVLNGFKEGVKLLIELGSDIYDEDEMGANYFHHLAEGQRNPRYNRGRKLAKVPRDPKIDLEIANILLKANLDIAKMDIQGRTPLMDAILDRNWHCVDFFLTEYAKLKEKIRDGVGLGHPLLWKTKKGATILHAIAFAKPDDDDEKEVFYEITRKISSTLTNFTDLSNFASSRTDRNETALHSAVRRENFEAVKFISAYSQEVLNDKDFNNNTALSIAGINIGLMSPHNHLSERIQTHIDIFNFLLPKVPQSKLAFPVFTDRLLEHKDSLKSRFDIQNLIKLYDFPFKDEHGWGLYDFLSVNGMLEYLISDISQKNPSPFTDFAQPSRYKFRDNPVQLGADLWENGLGFSRNDPDQETPVQLISDHPVPPTENGFYYFEIETEKIKIDVGACYQVGFYAFEFGSALEVSCSLLDGQVTVFQSCYKWPYARENVDSTAALDLTVELPNPYQNPNRSSWGFGISLTQRVAFFTVNGKMVPAVWRFPQRQYFPFFRAYGFQGDIKFNFGAKRFNFEEANDPEWHWDWRKAENEWGRTKQEFSDDYSTWKFLSVVDYR